MSDCLRDGENGLLEQIFVNGEAALPDGAVRKRARVASPNQKAAIFKVTRPRPEAYKGESRLAALVEDDDGDPRTIDDQYLVGAGPSRADPSNMGALHVYGKVEPWRSIFDMDETSGVVPYSGDCAAAEAVMRAAKPH